MKKLLIIIILLSSLNIDADLNNQQNNNSQLTFESNGFQNLSSHLNKTQECSHIFSQYNSFSKTSAESFFISSTTVSKSCKNSKDTHVNKVNQNTNNNTQIYSIVQANGKKEIVDKAKFDIEGKNVTDAYVQSANNYFGASMDILAPTIAQALIEGTINSSEMQNGLIHQAISHLVTTGQTNKGIVNVYLNHPWATAQDCSSVSVHDQIMINYAISRMAYCDNAVTIQLAQACLQNFNDHQRVGNRVYQDVYLNCYQTLLSHKNLQSRQLSPCAASIQKDLVSIIENDIASINSMLCEIGRNNIQMNDMNEAYLKKLYDRKAIVIETLQGNPIATELTHVKFNLPVDVCGYLMANNINYASFNNQNCIYFQHLLTSQIIDILKTNVTLGSQITNDNILANYIKHTCNLAVTAQQLNQDYQVSQATLLTDLSEIATIIGQATFDSAKDLTMGIGLGTIRSLKSWIIFADNLCLAPIETIGQGMHVILNVAQMIGKLSAVVSRCLPAMHIDPILQFSGDQDNINREILFEQPTLFTPLSEHYELIKTNITIAVDYSIPIIENILQRRVQENIADATQCVLDGIIVNKIGQGVSYVSQFGQTYLSKVAQTMSESIPAEFMHDPLHFASTLTGELIACLDSTGEFIKDVAQTTIIGAIDIALPVAKYATQEKVLSDLIKRMTNADQDKIKKLQVMFEKYCRGDILLPGLEKLEGVKQIEAYRKITNNFQNIEKLTHADIMYLNMCNGLYPHSVEINQLVKNSMLQVIDFEGNIVFIKKFDIFHSFLGEMRPNATGPAKKGGHMLFAQSKISTHTIETILPLEHGYFDIGIKHIADKGNCVWKTQFPYGSTPMENAKMMIEMIQDLKQPIKISLGKNGNRGFDLVQKHGQEFKVYVENEVAHFYPISSNA